MPTQKQINLARKLHLFMLNPERQVSEAFLMSVFKAHFETFSMDKGFSVEAAWARHLLRLHRFATLQDVPEGSRNMLVMSLIRRRTKGVWSPPKVIVKSKQA